MRSTIRAIHKYVGLVCAIFWLAQALTGIVLTFHREIDGLRYGAGANAALPMPEAVGRAAASIQSARPGRQVTRIMAAGPAGQLDVFLDEAGRLDVARLDGEGRVVRIQPWEGPPWDVGLFRFAYLLHERLLAGPVGHVMVGLSGIVLALNLLLGLKLGWPRRGTARRVLMPGAEPVTTPRGLYMWHRAIGLWAGVPLLLTALTGAVLVWSADLATLVDGPATPLAVNVAAGPDAGAAMAVRQALSTFPNAQFSLVDLPNERAPWYRVRLLQSGELREVHGSSVVFVAPNGAVLAAYDAVRVGPSAQALNAIYPLHTGEALGLAGRITILGAGAALVVLILLGGQLWAAKKKPSKPRRRL